MTEEGTARYSQPESPVRHSYPLAVTTEGFSTALNLCLKTMPYVWMRLGAYVAFTVAAVIWLALVGGVAYMFSGKNGANSGGGLVLFLIGFGLPVGVFYWVRQYVLYLLKAGHIAVLTRFITIGTLPAGVNQVAYGKQIVTDKFGQTNVMFALDALIRGVTTAFNRTLDWVAGLIPIPGLDSLMKVVEKIIDNATTYIDESIFSYNLARNDENVWRSSVDGLVYYAQNAKAILRTAVWVLIIDYASTFGAFLICLIPAWMLKIVLPGAVQSWAWLFAVALAAGVRAAFLRPIFLTMVMLTYHQNAHAQPINLEMEGTLSSASDKFQELLGKAKSWTAGAVGA